MSVAVLDSHFLTEKRPLSFSFVSALILHAVFLLFGGMVFVSPPEYGIDLGRGGIEVYLVAQPMEPARKQVRSPEPLENEISEIKENQNFNQAQVEIEQKNHGDGSSPVAGTDATTFYSPGGAWMEDRPGHLKNQAPYYPQRAIELKQEGLVMLSVWVHPKGLPSRVEIKNSSGFPLLDRSALTTVKKWKFSRGQVGFLAHEVRVNVPIRFVLEEESKNRII